MRKSTVFRELLAREEIVVAPAAYDCFSAMIVESLGFPAVQMSGFCLAASRMGMPDLGLEGRTLTVDQTRNMAACVDIPLFVDAGTGYGDALGVYLTVKELIRAGAAGCFIEDQTTPPTCPLLGPPEVVGFPEFLPKIAAALEARKDEGDEDFFLIARTDAARTLGLQEAIERAKVYRKAGADGIFLTGAPKTKEGLRKVFQSVDAPFMTLPAFDHGLTVQDYKEIGAKLLTGIEALVAAAKAITDVYQELKDTGFVKEDYWHLSKAVPGISKVLKADKWKALGTKYKAYYD